MFKRRFSNLKFIIFEDSLKFNIMQVLIQIGTKGRPKTFELTRGKAGLLMKFANFLADDFIDENSPDYKRFFEGEVIRAMKTKRTKSGNSLRGIIDENDNFFIE